ncbi:MAG: CRTAC1 family protein [Chitinophagales bacterium]
MTITTFCLVFSAKAQFVERSEEVGVYHVYRNASLIGGGVAIFDVNNDNLLDLFIVGGSQSSALYINNGNGFTKELVYLDIEDIDYYSYTSTGVAVGDINNDGWDDLFIATNENYPNFIMINNQNNTFDVIPSATSGIVEEAWSASASFGDINKDGWLDIIVANYISAARIAIDPVTGNTIFLHEGYSNYLYINNGDNSFTEESMDYGLTIEGTSLACTMTDFDNDNDVDIYIANDFGHFVEPNELYENNYPETGFTDISEASNANIGLFGMGIAIGDYDNDLDLDYYVTNLGKNELLQNNGDKTFSKATNYAQVGDSAVIGEGLAVGWGTGFFDYDNNGWLDLYISNGFIPSANELENPTLNPNAIYQNNQDGTFTDVSRAMGIEENGFCRGAAFGDIDNDGDLDLIFVPVNKAAGQPQDGVRPNVEVFYNETENNNNWVKLKLQGVKSNRNGYGSHIILHDSEGNAQMREVDGGSSHASSNSAIVHFGLGSAAIDSIEIFWINGMHQTVRDLEVNHQYTIIEDSLIINLIDTTTITSTVNIFKNIVLNIYPNPSSHKLVVTSINENHTLNDLYFQLLSMNGKIIQQSKIESFPFEIDLNMIESQNLILNIYNHRILIASKEISKL